METGSSTFYERQALVEVEKADNILAGMKAGGTSTERWVMSLAVNKAQVFATLAVAAAAEEASEALPTHSSRRY